MQETKGAVLSLPSPVREEAKACKDGEMGHRKDLS